MKFNPKQLDNVARVLGTLCASSIIGVTVGISRPETVTRFEQYGLMVATVATFWGMLHLLKE